MKALVAFIVGLLFAMGLGFSGMTDPARILGFFDYRAWDPSLIFVMMGAVGLHAIAYRLVRRRASPLLDPEWHVPTRKDISARLILGAAIFGIGWGLGGFCPGPALVSLFSGDVRSGVFVLMMLAGTTLFMAVNRYLPLPK